MKREQHIQNLIQAIPESPGIYQFYNDKEQMLYVGKAKSLRRRVHSYFNKEHDSARLNIMVKQIHDIKTFVVETEYDALLLENNFIKKYQPKYNVNLKDDKSYPWICIKNEPFPRIFYTRKYIKDGSQYFGPYASVVMVTTLLDMVRQIYKLRTCNLNLTSENIEKKKFKICLEYHIGNCKGPCEALQTSEDYMQTIGNIKDILKGTVNSVIRHLEEMMNRHAENVEYEKAQEIKEKIEILERYKGKSVIVSQTITNADVFSIVADEVMSYVNFLKVINGFIIQTHTIEMKKKLDESPSELLALAIGELRSRFKSDALEIIVPFLPDIEIPDVTFTVPKIGDKKHLLDLSVKNVRYYMREREEQGARVNPEHRIERLMNQMMKDLRMNEPPVHIECFDNSNFRGKFAVAAMSVFKNGKPSKKDYRHFTIKTVEGIDDFASMEEIIFRRYKRVLDEKLPLPQLIVIDGGKGQLSAALKSLGKLGLKGKVTVIGIAKKLEEIYYPGDSVPMYLDKKSETLKIIQQLRDEVHRFGITHHRNKRSKSFAVSELENIKGIGEATVHSLLSHFRSVKRIKESSEDELAEIIGSAKAKAVKEYFTSVAS